MGDELLSDQRRIAREQLRAQRPDELIIAEQERHSRAWARAIAGFFAALVIGFSIAVFVTRIPYLHNHPVMQNILVGVFFLLPLVAALVAMFRAPPAPPEANEDRIVRKTADLQQARFRWIMLAQIFNIFTLLPMALLEDKLGRSNPTMAAVAIAMPSVFFVAMGAAMFFGPPPGNAVMREVLNDELTRTLKRRAMQLGYFLTLVLFAGFGIASRFDAARAAHYLPLGLCASVVIPGLYFLFLDWKASRS